MSFINRNTQGNKARKQKGFTLVEILVASAIVAVGGIALFNTVLGGKSESEVNDAQRMIASDIPQKLLGIYQQGGRSYTALPNTAAGKQVITDRGIDASLPWGDTWTVSTSGSATAVTLTYTFTSASPSPQAALQAVYQAICTTATMTTATACSTIQPRYRMITSITPTFNATTGTLAVAYGIPR